MVVVCCLKCCLRLVVILIVVHCEVYLDEDEFDGGEAAAVYITTWPSDCTTVVLGYLSSLAPI